MRKRTKLLAVAGAMFMIIFSGCKGKIPEEASLDEIKTGGFTVSTSLHDPEVIISDGGNYYMFGTHMAAAKSENLKDWTLFAEGVDANNKLFDNLFSADMTAFNYVGKNTDGGYSVWAADVIYNKAMQKYVMYFCTSSSYIKSNLCFAIADNPEGPYTYKDTILYSGFTEDTVDETDFYDVMGENAVLLDYLDNGGYDNLLWPNCIDPSAFYDKDGKMWMVYGSWSGGIFLLELDEQTGYPIHPESDEENAVDKYFGKRLIGGGHNSIEGPYIIYNAETDYYYLFVSYGGLTSKGGYQIRQFRSENVDGPYVDAQGKNMGTVLDHSLYGIKMMGNYTLPSLNYAYMAPGGQSAFKDSDGKYYLVYHQRFDDGSEYHEPRVHQMFATESGWMTATPFATAGESLSEEGYKTSDLEGTFYLLNHKKDISATIRECAECSFSKEGIISGGYEGSFSVAEGSCDIKITVDDVDCDGVIVEMTDEAGNNCLCFSAVGSNNETLWGIHCLKNTE